MSCVCEIGTTPARLVTPTVGGADHAVVVRGTDDAAVGLGGEGHRAEIGRTAAPDPELEPHGLRSIAYGLLHWPPRPLHPLDESDDRKFAHSLRFAFPRMTAPPARSFAATVESRTAG